MTIFCPSAFHALHRFLFRVIREALSAHQDGQIDACIKSESRVSQRIRNSVTSRGIHKSMKGTVWTKKLTLSRLVSHSKSSSRLDCFSSDPICAVAGALAVFVQGNRSASPVSVLLCVLLERSGCGQNTLRFRLGVDNSRILGIMKEDDREEK
jgi:hypothetical protein